MSDSRGLVTILALVILFAVYAFISQIVMGVEVRRTGHTVGEVLEHAA